MDESQLLSKLCAPCRAIAQAYVQYERDIARANAMAKAARDKLKAMTDDADDAGDDSKDAIIKRRVGRPRKDPLDDRIAAIVKAKDSLTPRHTPAAKLKSGKAMRGVVRDIPVSEIFRNIRGEIRAIELARAHGVAPSTVRKRVEVLIGKGEGLRADRWKKGSGYVRRGKASKDILREKGITIRVAGEMIANHLAQSNARRGHSKKPLTGPTDAELQDAANGKVSVIRLCARYKMSERSVQRRIAEFRERFEADTSAGSAASPSNGTAQPRDEIVARVLAAD